MYRAWAGRNQLISAQQEIEALGVALEAGRREIEVRAEEVKRLNDRLAAMQQRVDELLESTSWRVTKPLRLLGRIGHKRS
jgi:hypothetical protein